MGICRITQSILQPNISGSVGLIAYSTGVLTNVCHLLGLYEISVTHI